MTDFTKSALTLGGCISIFTALVALIEFLFG